MINMDQLLDKKVLLDIIRYKMPYGKYKDVAIKDIPVHYLEWMYAKGGFPKGKLGMLLSTAHVIKTNGLEMLLDKLSEEANELD